MGEILNEKEKAGALRNIQLFSELPDKELHQINSNIVLKFFKKNETILYEEDTSEFMYIVLSGKVKVIKTTGEGTEISEMTGLTRETVTRVFDKWQKKGEITILKNKTIRLNPAFHKRTDLKDLQD